MSIGTNIKTAAKKVGQGFKAFGRWLGNGFKKIAEEKQEELFDSFKELAIPIAESVTKIDLNLDGRVSAAGEIVKVVEKTGMLLGTELAKRGRNDLVT
ncbi:MAG: hypothetical protein AB1489_34660, partial [Acidobacteriota bacterium]